MPWTVEATRSADNQEQLNQSQPGGETEGRQSDPELEEGKRTAETHKTTEITDSRLMQQAEQLRTTHWTMEATKATDNQEQQDQRQPEGEREPLPSREQETQEEPLSKAEQGAGTT